MASPAADGKVTDFDGGPGWEPRRYVPLVTRFFAEGGTRCLIGTRALLGEGWDAPGVNVVDRPDRGHHARPPSCRPGAGRCGWTRPGRRRSPTTGRSSASPTSTRRAAADYDRFVRKHDRYFALSGGRVTSSPACPTWTLACPHSGRRRGQRWRSWTRRMLIRAGERAAVRERWNIGDAVRGRAGGHRDGRPPQPRAGRARRAADGRVAGKARSPRLGRSLRVAAPGWSSAALAALSRWRVLAGFLCARGVACSGAGHGRRPPGSLEDMAMAVADALHEAGLASRGAAALRLEPLPGRRLPGAAAGRAGRRGRDVRRRPGRGPRAAGAAQVHRAAAVPRAAGRPPRGHRAGPAAPGRPRRPGDGRVPRRPDRARREPEAGAGVRAGVERPRQPRRDAVRRLRRRAPASSPRSGATTRSR